MTAEQLKSIISGFGDEEEVKVVSFSITLEVDDGSEIVVKSSETQPVRECNDKNPGTSTVKVTAPHPTQ